MNMRQRRIITEVLVLAAGFLLAVRLWAASLRVCGSCGHEALHDGPTCLHCGATLPPVDGGPKEDTPPPDAPSRPPAVEPSAPSAPALPVGVEADELRWARQMFDAGELWGATLAARNAAALAALRGEAGAPVRAEAAGLLAECRRRLFVVRRSCPVCDGTGRRHIQIVTLKGAVIDQELPALPCLSCKGASFWNARPLLDELSRAEAAARRLFAVEQLRRGREDYRGIWLPRGVADGLDVRTIAILRTAAGTPCVSCLGFGAIGCEACAGAGRTRCTNDRCVQGTEICPDCGGTGRSRTTSGSGGIQKRCDTCGGTGKRQCATCAGKGDLVCARCEGRGERLCPTCRGTGDAPVCDRCEGQGFLPCSRCAGHGEVRGQPCTACAGQGVLLCPNCQGSGRIVRRR